MPRLKVSYKRKSSFHGNRYTKKASTSNGNCPEIVPNSQNVDESRPSPSITSRLDITSEKSSKVEPKSSSSKKIDLGSYCEFEPRGKGNCIFDLDILSGAIKSFVRCKHCDNDDCIELKTTEYDRHGLAVMVVLECSFCGNTIEFRNSSLTSSKKYDINLKFIYALRTIGKGPAAGSILCSLLDLPSPPKMFGPYTKILSSAVKSCAEKSMGEAASEAVDENDGSPDLTVAIDGSWQRRGHKSLNGIVSVTSVDTGKVLDVAIMSKYCQVCTEATNKNVEPKKHDCTKNYEGASGGMEVAGAVKLFKESVNKGVRYTKYLGDGDSKGFQKVVDAEPYGEKVQIEKLECIGHVQKRMGSRLRRLKRDMKGKKLEDGKVLGGKHRLTDVEIDRLQNYYGLAIRRAVSEGKTVMEMRKNIWATYFHRLSTDEEPQHGLCPKGAESWCGYNKALALNTQFNHKNTLPEPVLLAIKKIYQDLTNTDLMSKCLHGRTQNVNESFNHVVWSKLPKTTFVRLHSLELGVFDSVLAFNHGHSGKIAVYKQLGLKMCKKSVNALKSYDVTRLRKAEKAAQEMSKAARQERRAKRKLIEEEENDEDDPDYGAGMF